MFISLLSMMFEILEPCRVLRLGTSSKKIIIIIIIKQKKTRNKKSKIKKKKKKEKRKGTVEKEIKVQLIAVHCVTPSE